MIRTSVAARALAAMWRLLLVLAGGSAVLAKAGGFFGAVGRSVPQSLPARLARRLDRLELYYEKSRVGRSLARLVLLPSLLAEAAMGKGRSLLAGSLVFKGLLYLAERVHLLLGAMLFFMVVVPYGYWNNLYALAGNLVLLALWILKDAAGEKKGLKLPGLGLWGFLFALAVGLAFALSINLQMSFRFFVFYIDAFLLVLLIVNTVDSLAKFESALRIFLAGVALTGVYGIIQWQQGIPVSVSHMDVTVTSNLVGRVYSTIGNPNNYAEVLVLALPFFAAFFLNADTWKARAAYGLMALPVLVSFLLTYSRSSWLGLAFAVFIFVLVKNWKLVPLFAVLGLAAFPFLPGSIQGRVLTIFSGDSSSDMRFIIWEQVWPLIKDYWAMGIGLGPDVFIRIMQRYPVVKNAVHAHNIFIQILIETGIVGILAFLAMHVRLLGRGLLAAADRKNPKAGNYVLAGTAAIFGFLLIGLVEYVWHDHRVMLFYFMVLGFLSASLRYAKEA